MKLSGMVLAFNTKKQSGVIVGDVVPRYRFYFYQNTVISGPVDIKVGDRVLFTVSPKVSPVPGRLPLAIEVEVLDNRTAVEILAGAVKS